MAQQNPSNPYYGQADSDQSRFAIAGDPRRMYPVRAYGPGRDWSSPPHLTPAGFLLGYFSAVNPITISGPTFGNCLVGEGALLPFGDYTVVDTTPVAIRLGVAGTSGGNILSVENPYGHIVANNFLHEGTQRYTAVLNGEAAYQDTNATTSVYGASNEQFLNNVAGTVSVANGGTTVTGVGTTFTTAALGGAAGPYAAIYSGNLASINVMRRGDLILITLDSGSKSWHRVKLVTDNTHLDIYPAAPSVATAKAYSLWRSGWGSYSRAVSIFNSPSVFNYYCGNYLGIALPGTIECFTRNINTGASSHFTAPQTVDGSGTGVLDIKAVDIAAYKGFLLYGFGSSISWSVAGFPTSYTVGFGATDFPAENISVVATDDFFIAFEYIGDQLIALFRNSVWLIQATGVVPEFEFYKIPDATGCVLKANTTSVQVSPLTTPLYGRPSVSAGPAVFYNSPGGLMKLSGGRADVISRPVAGLYGTNFAAPGSQILTWDQASNTIFVGDISMTAGLSFSVEKEIWNSFNIAAITAAASKGAVITGMSGVSTLPQDGRISLALYSASEDRIYWVDQNDPFAPSTTGSSTTLWQWQTPVISMGDGYRDFQLAGFQFDGAEKSVAYSVYGGRDPYELTLLKSGTFTGLNNRQLFGKKDDHPFLLFLLQGTKRSTITGLNLYSEGRGK